MQVTTSTQLTERIRVHPDDVITEVSPALFRLFFEDLNYSSDGGLNANLVNNYSYDAVYLDRGRNYFALQMVHRREGKAISDGARHWNATAGTLSVFKREDIPGARFGRLVSDGIAVLGNNSYPGEVPSMGAREKVTYRFEANVRVSDRIDAIEVRLVDSTGNQLDSVALDLPPIGQWQDVSAELTPTSTALAQMEVTVRGRGCIDLDEVRLTPTDHWGAGDPRWSQGVLRRDLVEALQDMKPTFLRFPGGCVVEGLHLKNAYDWRKTVGPLHTRRGDYNLWALSTPGGDYSQSHQVGVYEFFLLCEDLHMKPLPVINAGMAFQGRSREVVDVQSADFDAVIQSALDLIEWATADPAESELAQLRADAGHPEPFELDTIGIGNENFGPAYTERFERIRTALEQRHPLLTFVISSGVSPRQGPRPHLVVRRRQSRARHRRRTLLCVPRLVPQSCEPTRQVPANRGQSVRRGVCRSLPNDPHSVCAPPEGAKPSSQCHRGERVLHRLSPQLRCRGHVVVRAAA